MQQKFFIHLFLTLVSTSTILHSMKRPEPENSNSNIQTGLDQWALKRVLQEKNDLNIKINQPKNNLNEPIQNGNLTNHWDLKKILQLKYNQNGIIGKVN